MARYVGIDLQQQRVRAVLLSHHYRRVTVLKLVDAPLPPGPREERLAVALAQVRASFGQQVESVSVAMPDSRFFFSRLELPSAARRELNGVVGFELEGALPLELDQIVYAYRALPTPRGHRSFPVTVLSGNKSWLTERLELFREALGRDVDRVTSRAAALGNLGGVTSSWKAAGRQLLLTVDEDESSLVLLNQGELEGLRGVALGSNDFPTGAEELARWLRQSMLRVEAGTGGERASELWLAGSGVSDELIAFLEAAIGCPVRRWTTELCDGVRGTEGWNAPEWAVALGAALGCGGRSQDINLRTGALAVPRGYSFLKERLPTLAGLSGALVLSFLWATWAGMKATTGEVEQLRAKLGSVSLSTLGVSISEPEEVQETLMERRSAKLDDPLPRVDGYRLLLLLAQAVPKEITHDVDSLEFQRGKVKISGLCGSRADAERIRTELAKDPCVKNPAIAKVVQSTDGTRQKYVMDFEYTCEKPASGQKKLEGAKP